MKPKEMVDWFTGPKYSRIYYVSPYGDVRACRPNMTTRTLNTRSDSKIELTVAFGVYGRRLKEPVELTSEELFFNHMDARASLFDSDRKS